MEVVGLIRQLQPYLIGGLFLLLYVAEHLYPQRKELIDYRHDLRNAAIGLLNAVLIFAAGYLLQQWMAYYSGHRFGLLHHFPLPPVLRYTVEFLALDAAMYGWHRANHRVSFLWRFHRFHHEDEKLNSTSALRFHAAELLLSYVWRFLLFPLAGISIGGLAVYSVLFTAVVLFHHSGIRMPPKADALLRAFLVTPFLHRIHHSVLRNEADSNYSSVLVWWDRLFGSYTPVTGQDITFGTAAPEQPAANAAVGETQ